MEKLKGKKSLIAIIVIIFICIIALVTTLTINIISRKKAEEEKNKIVDPNMAVQTKAVVVREYDKYMMVMLIDSQYNAFGSVSYSNEGDIGFKKGQEILIHYDGTIAETYPCQLGKAGKIEILKDKSDVEIPKKLLRYCYNSEDKISITLNELTRTKISLTIKDENEIPYQYPSSYNLVKKNVDYEEPKFDENRLVGQPSDNSIQGYLRTRKPKFCMGRTKKTCRKRLK